MRRNKTPFNPPPCISLKVGRHILDSNLLFIAGIEPYNEEPFCQVPLRTTSVARLPDEPILQALLHVSALPPLRQRLDLQIRLHLLPEEPCRIPRWVLVQVRHFLDQGFQLLVQWCLVLCIRYILQETCMIHHKQLLLLNLQFSCSVKILQRTK